jgi:hypothetical protein
MERRRLWLPQALPLQIRQVVQVASVDTGQIGAVARRVRETRQEWQGRIWKVGCGDAQPTKLMHHRGNPMRSAEASRRLRRPHEASLGARE